MQFIFLFLCIQPISSYIFYNHKYIHFPRHIIKNSKIHRDIKKISSDVAVDLAKLWYNEIKTNCSDIRLLYSVQESSEQICQYTNFIYDLSHNYNNENEFLIWKPKIKPMLMNKDEITSSTVYPSYKETLGIVCYTNDKNKITINDYMISPYIIDHESITLNKLLKSIMIDYFLNYMKYSYVSFKM